MNVFRAAALVLGVAMLAPATTPAARGHALNHRAPRSTPGRPDTAGRPDNAVASAVPAWTPFQGPFVNPFATPPPPLEWPKIAPYPAGQGDTDGLSRNVDDCNKGCIDGPY